MVPLAQPRPSKRSFAEIGEEEGETLNSDELYGWLDEDEVTAEGLLVDEPQDTNDVEDAEPKPKHTAEIAVRPSNKMARFTTM